MSDPVRLLCTDGEKVSICVFPNSEVSAAWTRGVEEIKSAIAGVNVVLRREGREGAGTIADYGDWLVMVSRFIEEWGKGRVPHDVRHAYNSVQEGVGVPVTGWD